jgi:hypothetical protein
MMQQGLFVTVSRKWDNPRISINITGDEISLSMALADFLMALRQEIDLQLPFFLDTIRQQIGSVTWVFTQATFGKAFAQAVNATTEQGILDKIFQDAADKVVKGIKKESVQVI